MVAQDFYSKTKLTPINSTPLLIPGYVDKNEVEQIADFIVDLNSDITYSLLVFHPDFMMRDLPTTSLKQTIVCYVAVKKTIRKVPYRKPSHARNRKYRTIESENLDRRRQ